MAERQSTEINVELAYISPSQQYLEEHKVLTGATVADLLAQSKITERFPELDITKLNLGVFNKTVAKDYLLQAGDRVEIYRHLYQDPKEARYQRIKSNASYT